MLFRNTLGVVICFGLLLPSTSVAQQEKAKSSRWIGVNMLEIGEAIRHQLPDGLDGVLVGEVLPDLPAANAGLQQHDIIVAANGKAVDSPKVIVEAVSDSDEVEFTVLRKGKEMQITVVPVERPRQEINDNEGRYLFPRRPDARFRFNYPDGPEFKDFQGFFGGDDIEVFRPGVVMKQGSGLPNGVRIQIERQNDEPAKIEVQKGEESWSLTEDDLDQLPDKALRRTLRGMLRGAKTSEFHDRMFQVMPQFEAISPDDGSVKPGTLLKRFSTRADADDSINESIQAMQQQLEEITKRLDELAGDE